MARPAEVEVSGNMRRTEGLGRLIDARLADLVACAEALRLQAAPGLEERPLPERGDADAVHDARVATRRLRAALALYPLRPRGPWKDAERAIKAFSRRLGALRDLGLSLHFIEDVIDEADDEERIGIMALGFRLGARQAEARRQLAAAATEFFDTGVASVRAALSALDAGKGRLGGRGIVRRLRRRLRRVRRLLQPALGGGADFIHALRIGLKKLRYHAELLEGVVPGAKDLLKTLPPLQDWLGDLHDRDARLHWLTDELARAPRPELAGLRRLLGRSLEERRCLWPAALEALMAWQEEDPRL